MSRYVATPCERFWSRPESWPKDRGGHAFLARAFQRIGKALFGGNWTGDEAFADAALSQPDRFLPPRERRALTLRVIAEAGGSLGLVSPEWLRLSAGQRDAALQDFRERHNRETIESFKRAEAVREKVASAAASGELKTAWRAIEGGDFQPIARGFWNTERTEPRFCFCRMALKDPFSNGVMGTQHGYIFVEAMSAIHLVEKLPFAETQPLHVAAARLQLFEPRVPILGRITPFDSDPLAEESIAHGLGTLIAPTLAAESPTEAPESQARFERAGAAGRKAQSIIAAARALWPPEGKPPPAMLAKQRDSMVVDHIVRIQKLSDVSERLLRNVFKSI